MFSIGKKFRGTDLPEVTPQSLLQMFSLQNIAQPQSAPIQIDQELFPEKTQHTLNSAGSVVEDDVAAEFVRNRLEKSGSTATAVYNAMFTRVVFNTNSYSCTHW